MIDRLCAAVLLLYAACVAISHRWLQQRTRRCDPKGGIPGAWQLLALGGVTTQRRESITGRGGSCGLPREQSNGSVAGSSCAHAIAVPVGGRPAPALHRSPARFLPAGTWACDR